MNIKPVSWLGNSRERLREFPDEARKTPKPDIDLARQRFRDLIQERKQR